MPDSVDIAIVGAGAAGLMTGIWAGRSNPQRKIVALDGAKKLGAKILVAGGGRCNVTHDVVDEKAFAGSTAPAIRKILKRFDVAQTKKFFSELGVKLKREETGKLFPTTDNAETILDALLNAAQSANVKLLHPHRIEKITRNKNDQFLLSSPAGEIIAKKIVLSTGGKSLPKSGSDGLGLQFAQSLGHSLTPRIFPALVPLTLPRSHPLCSVSGITLPAQFTVRRKSGKILATFTDSTLCTHFGLSGPSVLDISRYFLAAQFDDREVELVVNWLPQFSPTELDQTLLRVKSGTIQSFFAEYLPKNFLKALVDAEQLSPTESIIKLTRDQRRTLVKTFTEMTLPISGNRGFNFAEVTAGGVPLAELRLETMESRICPGLYLCGEICDVDGRIGGYNFQWAWSSGHVVGVSI